MKIIIAICWFLIFTKLLLFWLWLWQLKEYHLGRFGAHFESQALRKILSSFRRIKYPKFTLKIIIIFFSCLFAEILLLWYFSLLSAVILTFFLIPLFVLSFQIPSAIWRQIIIKKAKKKRSKFKKLLVIGITGSYGKTSTKEFLAQILSSKFKVLRTKEHQNSEIGISQCILNDLKEEGEEDKSSSSPFAVAREHEIFIVEMAAYSKGGIKLLCDIAKPKIGIVTGVNEQHLATFGSMENLLSAEGGKELIESLPEDGMAFFNAKNKYCLELYEKTLRRGSGQAFLYGKNAAFLGEENVLGAMAVARELGMGDDETRQSVEKIKNKFPGIEIRKGLNGLTVIDASYSANPTGVMAHLDYLALHYPQGKKIIVMPCLIELGKASARIHRKIGEKIKEVCDLAIITTKDRFKEIKEGAGEKAILIENAKEIFQKLKEFFGKSNVILLESRVPSELIKDLLI